MLKSTAIPRRFLRLPKKRPTEKTSKITPSKSIEPNQQVLATQSPAKNSCHASLVWLAKIGLSFLLASAQNRYKTGNLLHLRLGIEDTENDIIAKESKFFSGGTKNLYFTQ